MLLLSVQHPTRFRLEHQSPPDFHTEVVTHDEAERHLRKLSRTACGCMRYGAVVARPRARLGLLNGTAIEVPASRLMLTMSADQPLHGSDYACHRCDDPMCAHPDHLYVGTHQTNVRDKFHPGRRIRPRTMMRFYDELLLEIGDQPPEPTRRAVHNRRPKLIAATCPPTLVMAA